MASSSLRPTFAKETAPRDVISLPKRLRFVSARFVCKAVEILAAPASVIPLQRNDSDVRQLAHERSKNSPYLKRGFFGDSNSSSTSSLLFREYH